MVNAPEILDFPSQTGPVAGVEWRVSDAPVGYEAAVAAMEARVAAIQAGTAPEQVWLLEHPPLYTAGTSATPQDLLDARFPVFQTGRGGQFTYHGPGQRVAYVMLDLKRRKPDVRAYVCALENWIIDTLAAFNIRGERRDGRIGVWVRRPDKGDGHEDKIAAILSSKPAPLSGRRTQTPMRSSRRSPRTLKPASVRMIHSSSVAT